MQIHEVVDNATLKIVLNAVNDDLLADVHQLQVSVVVLVVVGIDGFVNLLVVADAVAKVLGCGLGILPAIVGACQLDVTDIGHDDLLIVAFALDKQHFDAVSGARVHDPFAAVLGRIGCVKDADNAAGAEPGKHVSNGGLGCRTALPLTLGIVKIKEVGRRLWSVIAPIVADVESCRWN